MNRADVTSGAAFKAALRGTVILVVVLGLSSIAAFFYLQREMLGALENQIQEDQIVLAQIYRDGGPAGLVEVIDNLRHPLPTEVRAVGLFDATGRKLAGTIDLAPDLVGWSRAALSIAHGAAVQDGTGPARFMMNAIALDQFTLVVGRSLKQVEVQEARMLVAFASMGLVVSGAYLLLGYSASLTSLRKLGRMASTLDRVSQGDAQARLAVSPMNDQIDRVSRAMNRHLDRLSVLIATTRASAAAIAHDLRTPLSRAFLAVDRAQSLLDKGGDARSGLDEIEAELTRLRSICDAILRISRLEQDRGVSDLAPVRLAPLLADLAETFAPLAEDKGQTLTLLPVAPEVAVLGDAAMLAQLVANLTQNAISHCPQGTAITLGAAAGGGIVRLWVADTGPGIPEAEREKVFDLFYQVDPNRTGGGNGLGMALVKAIAERLGGRISLSDARPGLRVEVAFASPPLGEAA